MVKVLISHPTGNAFVRAAVAGLEQASILGGFKTTVAVFPGNIFDRISSLPSFSEFNRRRYNATLKPFTELRPWYELGRMASIKVGLRNFIQNEKSIFSIDAVYRDLDKQVASSLTHNTKHKISAVYAYEDGAIHTFKSAKRLGLQCFYDLPIGYWRSARRLLESERERWPEWIPTMVGFEDSEEKLLSKDEELGMADRIFVASSFTANTLKEYPGKLAPIEVIPYAFPPVFDKREYIAVNKNTRLKLLFVGGLSQRKGIADLFTVADKLKNHVELTVVGRKLGGDCPALNAALKKHRWISNLPHNEILKIMREHDVLVFPSLFEGFGLVITEAMSQGTPVITTDRTAGPDLIKHGENGWMFNAGSTEALQCAIEEILIKPISIKEAGFLAMKTAAKRQWEVYGKELAHSILNSDCKLNL